MAKTSFLIGLRDAMAEAMREDPRVLLMGEDVELSVYGSSGGLLAEFGPDRVMDVPLSEATVVGAAAGAAMVGMRPIVDITISPFLYPAADQIISIIAKARYMYGGQTALPLVIRSCMFYNVNNAAQHSDRPYTLFMSIPGLKIVVPSDAYDAKGLLKAAIRDPDPVLFFEDVNLWGSSSEIPDEPYDIALGKAAIKRAGSDVTVFAVAGTVPLAIKAADQVANEGISVEVIDPRTIKPLDTMTVLNSVARTGRLVAVDPAHRTGSVASEIAAVISEHAFKYLKAPIIRVTAPDVHIPFAASMEKGIFPSVASISDAIRTVMTRRAAIPHIHGTECMTSEVKLAQFGMGMTEGTPLRWLKKEGDSVTEGEPIVEVEAAKAVVEVLAPTSGKLTKILAPEGETVPVYGVIALID